MSGALPATQAHQVLDSVGGLVSVFDLYRQGLGAGEIAHAGFPRPVGFVAVDTDSRRTLAVWLKAEVDAWVREKMPA